jgi:hypothetical protein
MVTHSIASNGKRAVISAASLTKSHMAKQFRRAMERSLLDCIVYRGLISQNDLDAAVEEALSREVDLETVLLDKYRVPKKRLGGGAQRVLSVSVRVLR